MEIKEAKYISLQDATKYCNYSQEYLSLRARQGKLKAVKFGRNWVTKKEWLEEYLKLIGEGSNFSSEKSPLSSHGLSVARDSTSEKTAGLARSTPNQFLFYIALFVSIFIFWAMFVTPFYSQRNLNNNQITAIIFQDVFSPTSDLFKQYIKWLDESIKNELSSFAFFIKTKFSKGTETKEIATPLQSQEENNTTGEQTIPETNIEGIVVVLSTGTNEETVKKIKESFSDEVQVEQKDNTWGTIKPIFKNPSEQGYIYIMVPVINSSNSTSSL